jgi:hypothetical protein
VVFNTHRFHAISFRFGGSSNNFREDFIVMAQAQEFVDFEVEADFEKIEEFGGGGGFITVPPGDYLFEVVDVQQESSKTTNNPMVVVYSTVSEGQESDEAAAQTGQRVRTNYSLLPQAIGRLKQLMIACGAPLDKFRAGSIMGAKYRGTIVHSQGKAEANPDGTVKEAKTYANICNEKPLDAGAAVADAPPPPPVTKAKPAAAAAKPGTNGQAQQTRRA